MIVDLADEVAYISHDIDDGIEHGLISFEELTESTLVSRVMALVAAEKIPVRSDLYRFRFTGRFIAEMVNDILSNSKVITGPVPANEPKPIRFSQETREALSSLKRLLKKRLYRHATVMERMYSGKVCIRNLFDAMQEEPHILPESVRRQQERRSPNRVVADYIASLSDRSAMELYRRLF